MNFDLEKTVQQIKTNSNFLKLRNVIENNPYHDHESVYDHLVKTYEIASREINVDFITDPQAKEKFNQYVNEEVDQAKKKHLMLILALIHDIGKTVKFETLPDGTTNAKGHEYAGSLIVSDFVEGFSENMIRYLANGVRLHGLFNDCWNKNRNASALDLLKIVKSQSEGMTVEAIFNSYCDCFTATPFQPVIPLIHEILSLPQTYE
jgi:hypothetical protein